MKLVFLGADHEVTGSCHYLSGNGINMLVDCGMEQGADLYENQDIPVNAAEISYIFITHAHIDHSGLLPLLYSRGFRGKVYATKATSDLCNIMLKDSAHIQQFEAEWKNRKARRAGKPEVTPLYTMDEALGAIQLLVPCEYATKVDVDDGIQVRFTDAGHLLGSSSVEIWVTEDHVEKKIVFSGDIGNLNKPLIKAPHYIKDADYVLIESTYGDRSHEIPPDYASELAQVLEKTFNRGGNVVIPAFSVGRTQEMLYFLRKIKMDHLLRQHQDFEVYIDSPLAVEATNIFNKNVTECFDEEAMELVKNGVNPIGFPGLKVSVSSDDSKAINFIKKPIVIISASGMCEAGRIRHHLKHNLWRPESTILFVGFQVPGTMGNILLGGAKEVKLFGEIIEVHAHIEKLPGVSGHADREGLIQWIQAFEKKPQRVFVVHGDDEVCDVFAKSLNDEYGFDAVAPYSGDEYDLLANERVKMGSTQHKESAKQKQKAVNGIYQRLVSAGQRLFAVIRKNEGVPNKELAKFADQINSLCDKWER